MLRVQAKDGRSEAGSGRRNALDLADSVDTKRRLVEGSGVFKAGWRVRDRAKADPLRRAFSKSLNGSGATG